MQIVTPGLVLREVKVGESDRILTIFTPGQGMITASAKGSLRLKSKLFSACGLFCYSEFTLFAGKTMYQVDDAQVKQVFHGLSADVARLGLAMYLAEIAQSLSPTGKEAEVQLRLLLNSLYLISGGKKDLRQIKAVYELRAASEAGYLPQLLCCAGCGRYDGGDFLFELSSGALYCADCAQKRDQKPNLDAAALIALRHICLVDDRKAFSFTLSPASLQRLGAAAEPYLLQCVDKPLKSLGFLKEVLP